MYTRNSAYACSNGYLPELFVMVIMYKKACDNSFRYRGKSMRVGGVGSGCSFDYNVWYSDEEHELSLFKFQLCPSLSL